MERFLKKTILPEMVDVGEVEHVHIIRGGRDDEGRQVDRIRSKYYGETTELDVAKEKSEWRWRLIPEEKMEQHKDLVANFRPKIPGRGKNVRRKYTRERSRDCQ